MATLRAIGIVGILAALVCAALILAERHGWVTPFPSRAVAREWRRDTRILFVLGLALVIASYVLES